MSYNDRSEVREEVDDYTFLEFSFHENPNKKIKTLLLNRSPSGYGCQYIGAENLKVGQKLICENGNTYSIAWTKRSNRNSLCLGMGIHKENEGKHIDIETIEYDTLEQKHFKDAQDIIRNYQSENSVISSLKLYTVHHQIEKLESTEFVGPCIVLIKGKMKTFLPSIKGFSNRFAILSIDAPDWKDNLHRVLKFFSKQEPEKLSNTYLLYDSKKREQVIQSLTDLYPKVRSRDKNKIDIIIEEMMMNGLYDAPTDDRGIHKYASYSRLEQVILDTEEALEIKHDHKDGLFWLQAKDLFGSFPPAILLRYIKKCLGGKESMIDQKAGGAGLGLFMMWRNSHSLFLRVNPGRETIFSSSINTSLNQKSKLQSCLAFCIE